MDKLNYDIEHRHSIEEAILGAFLIDGSAEIEQIAKRHNLLPSDFRGWHHKALFSAILATWNQSVKVDLITVSNHRPVEFKQNEDGQRAADWDYLNVEISQKVSSTAHIEHHILQLKQYVLAEYWNNVSDAIAMINWNSVDVVQISDNIVDRYNDLLKRMTAGIKSSHGEISYEDEINKKVLNNRAGISSNVSTGSEEIDTIFKGGMSSSELLILAGRPGMMKTTIALIIAWSSAKKGNKVVFFSLEMPTNQLKNKIISLETGIDYFDLKNGNLNDKEWSAAAAFNKRIDESNLTIISDIRHVDEIAEKMRELSINGMCDFAVIDYLQLIEWKGVSDKMREGIVYITRLMKSLAKECYIPLMLLSQLNRGVESRVNKRPLLSDLKESGSIEEDADVVIFPFNEAYYALNAEVPQQVAESELWKVEFNIAKGRDIGRSRENLLTINPIKLTIEPYSEGFG